MPNERPQGKVHSTSHLYEAVQNNRLTEIPLRGQSLFAPASLHLKHPDHSLLFQQPLFFHKAQIRQKSITLEAISMSALGAQ